MFFVGKVIRIDEKKERGGKVEKKGDHDPELLRIVDKGVGGVLYLLVQEADDIDNGQDTFDRGGQGIEGLLFLLEKVENGDGVKDHRSRDQNIFKELLLQGLIQEEGKKGVFDDGKRAVNVKIDDLGQAVE